MQVSACNLQILDCWVSGVRFKGPCNVLASFARWESMMRFCCLLTSLSVSEREVSTVFLFWPADSLSFESFLPKP